MVKRKKGLVMKKLLKTVGIALVLLIELAFIGCAAVQDMIYPAFIEPRAIAYADVEVLTILPWTTVYDAKVVSRELTYQHLVNQLIGARLMEDDKLIFEHVNAIQTMHIQKAQEGQETFFSPTGPVGLAIAGLGFGTLGTIAGGRLIPRKKEKELEAEVKKLNGHA